MYRSSVGRSTPMKDEFNPARLDLARRRRGLTKTELSRLVGIATRTLNDYKHEYEPPEDRLRLFSEVLEFPVEFFFGPDLEEPSKVGSSFRSLSTLTATQRDRALAAGALALSLSDWIDSQFELPDCDVPQYDGVDSETAAEGLRSEWKLGEKPISNIIHVLESHGVKVFSLTEDSRDIDAFSFWRGSTPYIFLNTKKTPEHRRMDAAHELGHLVMHWRGGLASREVEREAQLFGSAFLMPRASVVSHVSPGARLHQIMRAKHIWKVALANLAYRLHTLELLNDWQYRQLFVQISRSGWRTSEPEGMARGESSQVLQKVFAMIRDTGTSLQDVARQLRVTGDELSRMIFGLALTPVPARLR